MTRSASRLLGLLAVVCLLPALRAQDAAPAVDVAPAAAAAEAAAVGPLRFTMASIYGEDVDLSRYQGQVVMIVNVASKCGKTPQYKQLEAIFETYKDQGFIVLGFPANDFGKQEPGTNEEILAFCEKNYGVSFDLFAKVVVKGEGQCPLYQYLTAKDAGHSFGGEITWNFEKFLVGRDGQLVGRYSPNVKPDAADLIADIEAALAVEVAQVDTLE